MMKIGIIGIFLSVIIFVAAMVDPQLMAPLGPLFCQPGETFTSQQYTSSYRPGETDTTDSFYCVNAAGDQRDVSGNVMGPVIIIYLVFLGGSVILTIIAGQRATGGRSSRSSSGSSNRFVQPTYDPQPGDANNRRVLRFGGQDISLDDLKANYVHQASSENKHTLADTLRQLEDAHKQGLIDSDEYGHLRQEALDKLV
ncbi:MAG TPA: hypothetical protein VHD90_26410 [Phototrophicaceae bacterium]|nr:hypothetical protein [Phototrophicaceae bacterium]